MDEIIERLNFSISLVNALEEEAYNQNDDKKEHFYFGKRMAYEEVKQMILKLK